MGVNQVLGVLCCACFVAAYKYELEVQKKLWNGDPVEEPSTFIFTNENEFELLKISFEVNTTQWKNVTCTSVYFANVEKNILKVDFLQADIKYTSYVSPYRQKQEIEKGFKSITPANPVKFDYYLAQSNMPRNTIAVSASISVFDKDDKPLLLNFYGIKNYMISLPDTFIVENYMRANFTDTLDAN